MPPGEIVWFLILLASIFYVASCFLLRLGCEAANCVGRIGGRDEQMTVPGYGTALAILIAACILMGLLELAAGEVLSLFGEGYFEGNFYDTLATVASLLLFTLMVSMGLRSEEQTPRSLALLASAIYVIIVIALVRACGLILAGF